MSNKKKNKFDIDDYVIAIHNWKKIIINNEETNYSISDTNGLVKNDKLDSIMTLKYFKTSTDGSGYNCIAIKSNYKIYNKFIHRLVAEAFIPNPDNKPQVNHKDGNKLNNDVSNLEWVTAKENKQHAIRMGLDNPYHGNQPKGENSGVNKYSENLIHEVCKLLEQNLSYKEISNILNVNKELPRSVKRRLAWIHISSQYNIRYPKIINIYSNEFRDQIKELINKGLNDIEISIKMGLPDPKYYGRKYVNKIRSRYNKKYKVQRLS